MSPRPFLATVFVLAAACDQSQPTQPKQPIVVRGEEQDQLHKLDEEIKAQVQDAMDFAEKSPEPPPEALYEDVLVDTTSDAVAEPIAAD